MGTKITVFHPSFSGQNNSTDFEGADLDYCMEIGGALKIMRSINGGEVSDTLFAAGQWYYVTRSEQAIAQEGEPIDRQIKDRIVRFIG